MKSILITGGAGFIGSHVVRRFVLNYPDYKIINLDLLTYAGNLENLKDIESANNYTFIKGDILNNELVNEIFNTHNISGVIHLAAESHVDRSISNPMSFVQTNLVGTVNLLNVAKEKWGDRKDVCFYHISTDEVYGSLGSEGYFTEETAYDPRSPYSASKAGSDHLVRAYNHTFRIPVKISNCSNNYGPYQFPEKLIPLITINSLLGKPLPVYGKGDNIRDWLHVEDHCSAIETVLEKGSCGETYAVGGRSERTNMDIVNQICSIMDELHPEGKGHNSLITYVKDRLGHDFRYAIDCSKIEKELGWKQKHTFEEGLKETVKWILDNKDWWENIISGEYKNYYEKQYG